MNLQDAFLDLILPVVSSTVKAAEEAGEGQNQPETAANVAPQVLKALRRRERLARHKKKPTSAEGNTIFKASSTCVEQNQAMLSWLSPIMIQLTCASGAYMPVHP